MYGCRSPLGLRGLKFRSYTRSRGCIWSQPSWAAWIEMTLYTRLMPGGGSQPSWAAWIEISGTRHTLPTRIGRSPLGLRGLKSNAVLRDKRLSLRSQPSWAAWIEIQTVVNVYPARGSRSPLGLRGLKLPYFFQSAGNTLKSQPSWAAWIEICCFLRITEKVYCVAALLGCVD